MTPATLAATGGTLSVSATVTDADGVSNVVAQLTVNGMRYGVWTLSNTSGSSYATTISLGSNRGAAAITYNVVIIASDDLGNNSTLAAGTATQAADNTGPAITAATLTPSTLPYAGGTLNVSATITDPSGISSAQAQIIEDGVQEVANITLSPSTTGPANTWVGSWTVPQNNDAVTHSFTAVVSAWDNLDNQSTQAATGTTTLAANPAQPITLVSATLTPATLPATGGAITVAATVADATWVSGINATILRDGVYFQSLSLATAARAWRITGSSISAPIAILSPIATPPSYTPPIPWGRPPSCRRRGPASRRRRAAAHRSSPARR